jgi:hypothetical protein
MPLPDPTTQYFQFHSSLKKFHTTVRQACESTTKEQPILNFSIILPSSSTEIILTPQDRHNLLITKNKADKFKDDTSFSIAVEKDNMDVVRELFTFGSPFYTSNHTNEHIIDIIYVADLFAQKSNLDNLKAVLSFLKDIKGYESTPLESNENFVEALTVFSDTYEQSFSPAIQDKKNDLMEDLNTKIERISSLLPVKEREEVIEITDATNFIQNTNPEITAPITAVNNPITAEELLKRLQRYLRQVEPLRKIYLGAISRLWNWIKAQFRFTLSGEKAKIAQKALDSLKQEIKDEKTTPETDVSDKVTPLLVSNRKIVENYYKESFEDKLGRFDSTIGGKKPK